MSTETKNKIQARHLVRNAYLYVRQSTLQQVFENTESTTRQYELRRRAIALGWPAGQVVVIDTDQGQSGASAADREGFQRLMTEVSMARAGIVMGLEVSRLARNSTDWHRLLEICALTDTLILDEDGIYDPAHFNDRLLLGLKGTMSEAELHVLRARLRGGILSQARRGAFKGPLPVGFVYDDEDKVRIDPDKRVRDTISTVVPDLPAGGLSRRGGPGLPPAGPRLPAASVPRLPAQQGHLGRTPPRPCPLHPEEPAVRRGLLLRQHPPAQAPGWSGSLRPATPGRVGLAPPGCA